MNAIAPGPASSIPEKWSITAAGSPTSSPPNVPWISAAVNRKLMGPRSVYWRRLEKKGAQPPVPPSSAVPSPSAGGDTNAGPGGAFGRILVERGLATEDQLEK